jgi:type VI secretion system secreted protein VgrG
MNGKGDCLRFRSGHRFALAEHYRDSFNQKYVLTHVRHEGSNEGADGAGEEGGPPDYRNTFVCVPAGVAYRPPRLTPEPKLPGVLTAKVESGGGTYAPIDDQGRYRVRMPFDLGDAGAAQATKPVRLAQPYTGPGYGQHFPVHKEAEMVIACVDGNVDRILGLSTIYNPSQFSPVTSDNAAQNVLRSWGQNELTFDDTQGAEEIYMHATKDHRAQIVNDQQSDVGNNRSQLVGTNETLTVGQDQTEDIGRDRTLAVGANESITVSANRSMTVGASLTESVGASMSLTVATTKDEAVGVASTITIGAAYVVSVGAAKTESIGGASAETVGGSKSLTVGSDASTNAGGSLQLTAGKDYALSVGKKATLTIADDAVVQAGKNVTIQAGKKAVIEVADQLTLKCGKAEIVLKKNGDISIKGGKIDVKGSGKMTLKGSQIAQN